MGLFDKFRGASGDSPEKSLPVVSGHWLQRHTLQRTDDKPTAEIVGEASYLNTLIGLAGGRSSVGCVRSLHTAHLRRDPRNQYDGQAVEVLIAGHLVGFIPRSETSRWHPVIAHLAAHGLPATCPAEFTGGWDRGRGDQGNIGVRLLGHPSPATGNEPTLIGGASVTVTGEEAHQDVLAAFNGHGRVVAEQGGEQGIITVWLNRQRVGQLTAKTGQRYGPLLAMVHASGAPLSSPSPPTRSPFGFGGGGGGGSTMTAASSCAS